ncbi:hypothetical protein B2G50_11680 [Leptospira interrogans serovar Canicola]|nr:hypothetical protein B2G50_11680 [Leptospira interrogans serovar Canicola]
MKDSLSIRFRFIKMDNSIIFTKLHYEILQQFYSTFINENLLENLKTMNLFKTYDKNTQYFRRNKALQRILLPLNFIRTVICTQTEQAFNKDSRFIL